MTCGRHFGRRLASFTLTLAALALGPAWGLAAQDPYSLEQIMEAPFPSGLIADHGNGGFAWVLNEGGARNIWIVRPPEYTSRRLTSYVEDDGQEISSLRFTPDDRRLFFVRGGAPNRGGEIPNPTSDAQGAERIIWVVDLDGPEAGQPRRVTPGSSPIPSPDGSRLVFLRRGQIWSITADATPEEAGMPPAAEAAEGEDEPARGPRQLLRTRGSAGSLRWSPDGKHLAFVSSRGDHSFIGLFSVSDSAVRYLDPSLARDGSPTWSPDGSRLAFVRILNERDRVPFAPIRSALPWSIRVVDVATGDGSEVWRASEGTGSAFRRVEAADQLWWAVGDRIVFPWERDGWTHLYTVAASGGEPSLLTPGAFEVEHVTLSRDRERLIYSSNEADIDRRHLWSVDVARGAPVALTQGSGIEWSPAAAAEGPAIAFLASDARTPAHAEILHADGRRRRLDPGSPGDFPLQHLVTPEAVTFLAEDGIQIHGQLFTPADLSPGDRRPAVLFFHGGSRRQMLLGWHYRGYYHNAYAMNQYLASRGYVVLSVNYRSGIGYGMEFREALDYGARGASEYRDVVAAGRYLARRSDVDPTRIGLWGGSYGGYLTALGLARDSDLFVAGVDLHGVHDWNVVIRNFVPAYQAERRAEVARLAFESSPMASVDGWRSPVLLIHGDDDRNVPFSESVDLIEALERRNVVVEQLVFPDEVHSFLLHRNWLAAYRATADFFDRMLRGDVTAAAGPDAGSQR
jgi:dipeptidyl aminopeptidase/acylaminoacyl peptidase